MEAHVRRVPAGRTSPGAPEFSQLDYNRFVDGKPRADGVRDFLASRGITLPEGAPGDPADAATVQGIASRKNELVLQELEEHGVEVYPGSVTYLKAVKEAGLATAVVTASANGEQVIGAAGFADLIDVRVDGVVAAREGLRGKPAPDTFLAGARLLGVEPARGGGLRGRAVRGCGGPGGELRLRRRRRPRGPRRRAGGQRCRRRRPGPGGAAGRRGHDRGTRDLPDRAVVADRGRPRPRLARGARVGVRPDQRAHRHARLVRGGRAGGHPRHLPQRVLRGAAAALRGGRLRVPRAGPDDGQRHRRQADPAAGEGLAARPRLRRDHRAHAHPRPAGRRAAPVDRVAVTRWPDGAGDQHPARLAGPAVDRRHRVQGGAHRRPRRPLRRPAVGPAGQRDGADRGRRPARRGRDGQAAAVGARGGPRTAGRAGAPDQAQPPAHGGRHGPHHRDPRHAAPRTSRPPATWPGTRWPPGSRPAAR